LPRRPDVIGTPRKDDKEGRLASSDFIMTRQFDVKLLRMHQYAFIGGMT